MFRTSLLLFCLIIQPQISSQATDIYVLGTATNANAEQTTSLGVINTDSMTYQSIQSNIGGSSQLAYNLAWIPGTSSFYTIYHSWLNGELRILDRYGNLGTSIGNVTVDAHGVIYGMVYDAASTNLLAYNWMWNNYGYISTTTGQYFITNQYPFTGGNTTTPPVGGRMTSHQGKMYSTINDADVAFRFVEISQAGNFTILNQDPLYKNMILASDESLLYGLVPNNATSASLYSLNPSDGTPTLLGHISGTNLPNYFIGAAVPEPSTNTLIAIAGLGLIAVSKWKQKAKK
ncbi:MAG: hypothetical protein RJA81_1226 [Planctomycetota bacterium]